MFGMGGFQLLPFYDAARRLKLDHHLINDERAGVFAADAYAKCSGRVGLVDATLGPGATNLVTGLVEALNAGTPLVAIIGDAHRDHATKNMTQEARQIDILRPASKEVLRVEHAKRIPELVRRAFQVATSGRPGPVVLNVPEDVCHATHGYDARASSPPTPPTSPPPPCAAARTAPASPGRWRCWPPRNARWCWPAAACTLAARRRRLTDLAGALNLPVAHTMTGKGAIACTSPLNAGLFGRYDRIANALIAESDLLLVIGCKLGEIATKRYTVPPPGSLAARRIVHIDIVAEEIGRTAAPALPLWGDARESIRELQAALVDTAQQPSTAASKATRTGWKQGCRPGGRPRANATRARRCPSAWAA